MGARAKEELHADVCVIGSGGGGAPVAWYLAERGYRVVVLERGWWLTTQHFRKDELGACRRPLYVPPLHAFPHELLRWTGSGWRRSTSFEEGVSWWNATLVGGATNIMSGYFHRMHPNDFRVLSRYGQLPGGERADWPITYDDLEPWYTLVEKVVGISGEASTHPWAPPRSADAYPYPPLRENRLASRLDEAARGLGYRLVRSARAILSRPADHRKACYYSGYCGSYGCASDAKGSARVAFLNPALETGLCTILPLSPVVFLEADRRHVLRAWYRTPDGTKRAIRARVFVLACGPIETVRLLLLSRSPDHPHGLGNRYGQVGKYLLFSAGGVVYGTLHREDFSAEEWEAYRQRHLWINRCLYDFYEWQDEQTGEIHKGGMIEFMFEHLNPIRLALMARWHDSQKVLWGRALQQRLYRTFHDTILLRAEIFCDWTPNPHCFLSLSDRVKDQWGLPVAAIHIHQMEADRKTAQMLADHARRLLEAIGCRDLQIALTEDDPPVNLVAGGCRMGRDPRRSVTDPTCRVHTVDNLYITDASTFPSGGSVPFTWTIYANALRVAHGLAERLGGTA